MKKYASLLIFLWAAFLLSGFSFSSMISPLTGPLYQNIREQATASFSDMFSGKVSIGSAGGVVVGQIVLHDVKIGEDIEASRIVIDFNPIKFARAGGNVVPAITRIRVIGGDARIVRKRNGDINALHFMKPPKPGAAAVPFRAKLALEDCAAEYTDEGGLPYRPREVPFKTGLSGIHGTVDLSRSPEVKFDLLAMQAQSQVMLSGKADQQKGKVSLKLVARDLDLSNWGTYVVPYLDIKKGKTNLVLDLNDDRMDIQLAGAYDDAAFTVSGQVVNKLDLSISLKNADLKSVKEVVPAARAYDLSGIGSVDLAVSGPYDRIGAKISATVRQGQAYGQKFSGNIRLNYADDRLTIEGSKISAYNGTLGVKGAVDLSAPSPRLDLAADINGLDLNLIAGRAPVISGRISGKASIAGPADDLAGSLRSDLAGGSVMGQRIDRGEADFRFNQGKLLLDAVRLSSDTGNLSGSGSISMDRVFDLNASASGIRLKGSGALGEMQALVDHFNGNLSFRLDDAFIKAPLKNLIASGTTEVSDIRIGEQRIDRAGGGVSLYQGKIDLINSYLMRGASILYISGEAGLGMPTAIALSGNDVQLSDLKLLNFFLPTDLRDPTGTLDLDVRVGGKLDKLESPGDLIGLSVSGKISVTNGKIGGVEIGRAYLDASWQDRNLRIQDLMLRTGRSEVTGRYLVNDGSLEAQLTGGFDLDDLAPATKKIGIISGQGTVAISLKGDPRAPRGKASVLLKGLRYNSVQLQSIDGELSGRGGKIDISRPIVVVADKEDQLKIVGGAELADDPNASALKLELQLEKGNISTFYEIIKNSYLEGAKFVKTFSFGPVRIDTDRIGIAPPPFSSTAYHEGRPSVYLNYFEKVSNEVSAYQQKYEIPALMKMTGAISGKLKISGTVETPTAELVAYVNAGSYGKYDFDNISLSALYERGTFTLRDLSISEGNGRADVWGTIDPNGALSLKASSKALPLDILKVAVDKKFDGWIDLTSDIEGTVADPSISASFTGYRPGLAGVGFDELTGRASYAGGTLNLSRIRLSKGKDVSTLDGHFNFAKTSGRIKAGIEGEAAGLINLLTDELAWRKGRSHGSVEVSVEPGSFNIAGGLTLTDADIYVKRLDADISGIGLSAEADGNQLIVRALTGTWYGKSSRLRQNNLSLAGSADLVTGSMSWLLADTHLSFDFPGLYIGEMDLSGMSVAGTPDNLAVKGTIDLSDGILTLPRGAQGGAGGGETGAASPVKLNLTLNMKRNMYLTAGDVLTLDLSNMMLNLEMAGQGISVLGSLSDPKLSGKVIFKRGTVNILNREFSLLSEDDQKTYYPYDLTSVSENYAQFNGDGIMPALKLTAMVKVEDQKRVDSNGKPQEVMIVSKISGIPQSREESKILNISFNAFEQDTTKGSSAVVRSKYSDDEIKVLLLPDFIKSIAGVEQSKSGSTSGMVADYLNSRIQSLLFRNLERGIESALGLESLTLEYNFGSDIRRAMGVQDTGAAERSGFGVGFVKGFFDKLYINVRYSQDIEQQQVAGQQSQNLNYQITYKLSRIWSVDYYREPANIYDLNSGYYKTTLKAGYSF